MSTKPHYYKRLDDLENFNNEYSHTSQEYVSAPTPPTHISSGNRRLTRKTLGITLGSLMIVVVLLVVLFTRNASPASTQMEKLSALDFKNQSVELKDVLSGKYYAKSYNGTWVGDDEIQYFSEDGDLMIYNALSNSTKVLISGNVFHQNLRTRPYQCLISPSKNYILVAYDPQKVYRHSLFALYDVYDVQKGTFTPLSGSNDSPLPRRIQLAVWSPKSDSLAFVQGNDIYYKNHPLDVDTFQVTRDGSHLIYNGVTDWVYEEEMFSSNQAVWINVDYLAYVQFNDSLVDQIQYPLYGDPGNPQFQYPILEAIPYPKSGRINPLATVRIVNLKTKETAHILIPNTIPQEHIIGSVQWTKESNLLVNVLNRHQNNSWILLCTPSDSTCQIIHHIEQSNGWIDVKPIIEFNEPKSYLLLASVLQQNQKSYHHIVNFNEDSIVRTLSRGEFSVDSILGVKDNAIYFTAPRVDTSTLKLTNPSESHLYRLQLDNSSLTCLTCDGCPFNTIDMSKDLSYFVQSSCDDLVPNVQVKKVNGEIVTKLVGNEELKEKLEFVSLPISKSYKIPTEKGYFMEAKLWLPRDFDESKKYPMLIDVYGGPGSQKIADKYTMDWGVSLVSSKNVIYGSIDGRGSGKKSDDFMFEVYRKLGTVEIQDQIHGAKWLVNNVPFLDKSKVAIWGWSYGGFVTAMVMGKDTGDVYKCGISVAPVTNWAFYDTIYTERYMGLPLPEDNFDGYNSSDVTNFIDNFRHKKYLLVHGNADDNVHYQQSMVLSRALEKADVLFRQQSYPDENHGLGGVRRHLYHTLEDFLFNQCFS